MMEIGNVNYVAVLAAAIATFIVGFIWYGPLFGKKWAKLAGVKESEAKKSMGTAVPLGFVGVLVWAFVLAHFVSGMAMMDALKVGVVIWLGFALTKNAGAVIWQGKSKELFMIDSGHDLVTVLVASAVLVSL